MINQHLGLLYPFNSMKLFIVCFICKAYFVTNGADEAGTILAAEQVDDDGVVALLVDAPCLVSHFRVRSAVRFYGSS